MPWGAAAAVAGAVITSQAMKGSASSAADAQRAAAESSAAAQIEAARINAEASKFRPVGISTRFGTSTFTKDEEGNIKEAGYTLSPELKAIQDYAMAQAAAGQADTTGLLGLGRGYLATSPEAAAQDYMAKQRALYAPGREQTLAALRNQQLQTGRAGLATGGTAGMAATNPEMAAYYNALAQQEAQLAANADLAAQQRITFGQGLLSSAYSPIATPLGLAGQTESMGQGSFDLGVNLGGRQTQANQAAAQLYQTGVTNAANTQYAGQVGAAKTMQAANAYSPVGAALTGLGQQMGTSGGGAGQLGSWFNNMLTNYNFGSSGMTSGMSGGMAPGVEAPAAATWENAFATGWDR